MRPLSPTLSKLPVIVCGSPSSPLVTNCTSTVSSIQSLSFTMPPSVLFSTRLSSSKHPTPQGSGLRRILHPNFRESPKGEVRRISILGTSVNRVWALLRACPLHGVDHLLRLGRELFELASRTNEANRNRLTLYVLQDDAARLFSFNEQNWSASA